MSAIVVVHEPVSAEAFATLALGVLLERVARSTDELILLRVQLQTGIAPQGLIAQELDLAKTCAELEAHGWLFGVLACELGSDVLFERREQRGLESLLDLVREILARDGVALSIPALPELDSNDARCATVCAVVARCVHAAHLEPSPPTWCFAQREGNTSLCFDGRVGHSLERALSDGAARIPGALLVRDASGIRMLLPDRLAVWP